MGTFTEKALSNLDGDAEAGGGVLAIDDDEVDVFVADNALEGIADDTASGAANDVADK